MYVAVLIESFGCNGNEVAGHVGYHTPKTREEVKNDWSQVNNLIGVKEKEQSAELASLEESPVFDTSWEGTRGEFLEALAIWRNKKKNHDMAVLSLPALRKKNKVEAWGELGATFFYTEGYIPTFGRELDELEPGSDGVGMAVIQEVGCCCLHPGYGYNEHASKDDKLQKFNKVGPIGLKDIYPEAIGLLSPIPHHKINEYFLNAMQQTNLEKEKEKDLFNRCKKYAKLTEQEINQFYWPEYNEMTDFTKELTKLLNFKDVHVVTDTRRPIERLLKGWDSLWKTYLQKTLSHHLNMNNIHIMY